MVVAMTIAVLTACEKDEANLYNVTVTAGEGGTVAADNGKHKEGEEISLVAVPNVGYTFSCWSDGVKSNPRIVTVQNTDIILVALFAQNGSNTNNSGNNNGGGNSGEVNAGSEQYLTSTGWGGSLPIRSNYDAQTNSSYFSFDEGKKGTEEAYIKGKFEQTYNFTWDWYDDAHTVLVLNYGGEWAEDKCCIDIKELAEDHIYGYFYGTLTDYENYKKDSKKYSIGTKVELKLVEVAEEFTFSDLTIIANADGTIDIAGHIETNTKLKEFALYMANGNVAYDFLEQNEQVKEKNNSLDKNGRAIKGKSFKLDVKSAVRLPVAIYTLVIKTKKNTSISEAIGADYSFKVGTGSNTSLGSQISLVNQRCYMLSDFYKVFFHYNILK